MPGLYKYIHLLRISFGIYCQEVKHSVNVASLVIGLLDHIAVWVFTSLIVFVMEYAVPVFANWPISPCFYIIDKLVQRRTIIILHCWFSFNPSNAVHFGFLLLQITKAQMASKQSRHSNRFSVITLVSRPANKYPSQVSSFVKCFNRKLIYYLHYISGMWLPLW